jgi:hypothetical protein
MEYVKSAEEGCLTAGKTAQASILASRKPIGMGPDAPDEN